MRRWLIAILCVVGMAVVAFLAWPSGGPAARREHRVLVLGIDGMDPELLRSLMDAGRMPNFARLAASGTFVPLQTSIPPQSPVAWSDFITGAGPGTHQIYDFIHRDADPPAEGPPVIPYLSTSVVDPPARDWTIAMGDWRLPLFGAATRSLRQGRPFWDDLVEHDVETAIYRVPANYPPPPSSSGYRCVCGMGTPDLLGTYGTFTFMSSDPLSVGRSVSGGRFVRLRMRGDRGRGMIAGPDNFLRAPAEDGSRPPLTVAIDVVRDPEHDLARIDAGGAVAVLAAGEWSDWLPVRFETGVPGAEILGAAGLPTALDAMVRVYLKSVHPEVELYVSPLNIDPLSPVNPVGAPNAFVRDLAAATGRFYTTGIPEDTKALRSGALTEDEFLAQVGLLKEERLRQFHYAIERHERGFLFFYFGHVDQLSHIFWRDRDPGHPAWDQASADRYRYVIDDAYVEMDALLGAAMARLDPEDTIIVMSDHGFTSFRRGVNLNAWLRDNGYLFFRDDQQRGVARFFAGVDWSRTRAYALGLNGLYLNLAGRERSGIVAETERRTLLEEIAAALAGLRDDEGTAAVERLYIVEDVHRGADPTIAPDMIIGYADNYRGSWATAEGGTPLTIIEDNTDRWSGDHCISHVIVPGILLMNRPLAAADPALIDLAPTVLTEFGIEPPPAMTGRPLVSPSPAFSADGESLR